jgi:Fanconi anemia group M protein
MSDQLQICIDSNEASIRKDIVRYLILNGLKVEVKGLTVCDYVVSDRVGVERKDTSDFFSSMKDGRLFEQAKGMAEIYERPILILEGGLAKAFRRSRMRPSSVYGALSSIALDYGLNIIPTDTPESTGLLLHRIAYREQIQEERTIQLRNLNRSLSLDQQQIFLLSGLPQIGKNLAQELLKNFDTPKRAIQELSEAKIHISTSGKTKRVIGSLSEIKGIGPIIIERAQSVLNKSWRELRCLDSSD